jgi:hypothetical protein
MKSIRLSVFIALAAVFAACEFDAPIDKFFDNQTGSVSLMTIPSTAAVQTGTDGVLCAEPGTDEISIPFANEQGYALSVERSWIITGGGEGITGVDAVMEGNTLKITVNGVIAKGDELTVHVKVTTGEGRIVYAGDIKLAFIDFDTTLEKIELSGADLSSTFDPAIHYYGALYPEGTEFITLNAESASDTAVISLTHISPGGNILKTETAAAVLNGVTIAAVENSVVRLRLSTPHEAKSTEYNIAVTKNNTIYVSGVSTVTMNSGLTAKAITVRAYTNSGCTVRLAETAVKNDGSYAFSLPLTYLHETVYLRNEIELLDGTLLKNPAPAAETLSTMNVNKNLSDTVSAVTPYNSPKGTVGAAPAVAFAGEQITVTPSPAANYITYSVSYNGTEITGDPLCFNMPGEAVTLSAVFKSTEKSITDFRFTELEAEGEINGTSITVTVPYGTDRTSLLPILACSAGADYEPKTAQNFTVPVTYTVTAEAGGSQQYTVTVSPGLNHAKEITSFTFANPPAAGVIVGTDINVRLPFGTVVTGLAPTIVHTGASINFASGTPRNFTNPVTYTVYAENGTWKQYTVTVTVADLAQWGRNRAEPGSFRAAAVDGAGNVYAVNGTGINGGMLTGPNALVKYDSSGNVLWEQPVTDGYIKTVVVDSTGNVYVAGSQLVKYSSSGVPQSSVTLPTQFYLYSAAVDSAGNVYAAGRQGGGAVPVDYGNGVTLQGTTGLQDAALVKYSGGGAVWARLIPLGSSADQSAFYAAAVDSSGVYAAGRSGSGAAIVHWDSSGTLQWAKQVTGGDQSRFESMAADGSGNIYVTGYQMRTGQYDYGNGKVVSGAGSSDNHVLVKYAAANGAAQWVKFASDALTGVSYPMFYSVAADSSGSVYAAGNVVNNGFKCALVKYDSAGVCTWKRTTTGISAAEFRAVAADGLGNVFAAGYQGSGAQDYGNGVTITVSSSYNAVIVKYHE